METCRSLRLINSGKQRKFADGTERWMGRMKWWRSRSRGPWAGQSFGQRFCPLAGSLAWGRAVLTRRASTQAKWRPSHRGVESVEFGCDDWTGQRLPQKQTQNRVGELLTRPSQPGIKTNLHKAGKLNVTSHQTQNVMRKSGTRQRLAFEYWH